MRHACAIGGGEGEPDDAPGLHVLDPIDGYALFLAARYAQAPPPDPGPYTDAPLWETLNAVEFR